MTTRSVLPTVVGLTLLLGACSSDTTEPNPAAVAPQVPELAVTSNTWITRASMPANRTDLAVATVTNAAGQSIVYALGGLNPNRVPLDKVTAYNVATDTWTFRRPLPVPLAFSNGAGVINGKIYISGGLSNYHLDDLSIGLYVYDPAANTWTRKNDLPIIRSAHGDVPYLFGARGVTGVIGGKLYVFTACYEQNWAPSGAAGEDCNRGPGFFRYNPVTDQWTILPSPFDAETRSPYTGGVINGEFYVMGGRATTVNEVTTVAGWFAVYDPTTNQWTPRTPLALGRPGAATAVLGAKLYVMGGRRYNASETLDVNIVYDPATDRWTRRAPLPSPRSGIVASKVLLNGQPRIEVVGGIAPGNNLQFIP